MNKLMKILEKRKKGKKKQFVVVTHYWGRLGLVIIHPSGNISLKMSTYMGNPTIHDDFQIDRVPVYRIELLLSNSDYLGEL